MTVKTPERHPPSPASERARERRPGPAPEALGSSFGANTLFLVVAVVGLLHLMLMFGIEANRLVHARGEIARLEREVAAVEQERAMLEAVVAHQGDARFREQLARTKGFVFPDERQYITLPLP